MIDCEIQANYADEDIDQLMLNTIRRKIYREHVKSIDSDESYSAELCFRTQMWRCKEVTPEACRLVYSMNKEFRFKVRMILDINSTHDIQMMERQFRLKSNITGKPTSPHPHFLP